MGHDYIPESDRKAAVWMKRFAAGLVDDPQAYRTTPEDAAEIQTLVTAFRVANINSWPIGTRNKVLVKIRNQARKAAEALIRTTAQRIRTDPRIASDLKVKVGLKPPGERRSKIPPPQSAPVLQLSVAMSGILTINAVDSASSRRARPNGVAGMELYEQIIPRDVIEAPATEAEADPTVSQTQYPWRFIGVYSRTPIELRPALGNFGDQVSYVARWITKRGEPAGFGQPVSTRPPFSAVRDLGGQIHRGRRAA